MPASQIPQRKKPEQAEKGTYYRATRRARRTLAGNASEPQEIGFSNETKKEIEK
jgi:hypothetical protein